MSKNSKALFDMYTQMGFEDAPALAVKAEAVMFIRSKMDKHKMTQKELASRIGWSAPRLSNLLRGKLDLFSQEKINEALKAFGYEIRNHPRLEKATGKKASDPHRQAA
jgi:predicted XRE-type DNA-binding protein